jgi:Mlc titration factor MtfA (ptsG expression regulator)
VIRHWFESVIFTAFSSLLPIIKKTYLCGYTLLMIAIGFFSIFLLFILVIFLNRAMKDGWYLFLHESGLQKTLITGGERSRINDHLRNFTYYTALSPAGKEKFVDRLFTFMLNKEFKGRSGLVVTEEMRVLISASAIQLTFGLNSYKLESLQIIFIFPDNFHLSPKSPEYKGATTGHFMYLSWKAFQEGYLTGDDNLNLGLHEMTHALKLTLYLGNRFDKLFASRMEYWEELVAERFKQLSETKTFLRSYSKANTEEFFAVCVEAFFESPEKFKRELPEIFQLLTFLLNQDILNKTRDYQVNEGYFTGNIYDIPLPHDVKSSYRYSNSHWSMNVLITGTLFFLPTVLIVSRYFIFSASSYFLLFIAVGTIGLVQKRYFFEHKILSGTYFVLYSYAGFGASFTAVLLWLNFLIPVTPTHTKKFKLNYYDQKFSFTSVGNEKNEQLEHDLYDNNQILNLQDQSPQKYIVLNYHYGILGIIKVEDFYFTNTE